jgi:hypothetical protein
MERCGDRVPAADDLTRSWEYIDDAFGRERVGCPSGRLVGG